MISSTLWAEVVISGFLFLMAGAFLILKGLGIDDLGFLNEVRDYVAVAGVGAIAASYVLGVLFHRLISMFGKAINPWLYKRFRLGNPPGDEYARAERARIAILQYGSERLLKEMDYQFNFLALFSQLSTAFPVVGICAALWLADTPYSQLALPVLIAGLALGLGFIIVLISQSRTYRKFKNEAYLEVATMRDRPPREG